MALSQEIEERLYNLVDVFLKENAVINLSAFRTAETCWTGNVLDSLAFLDIFPELKDKLRTKELINILDIGTGGGFPLLPLAITLPEVRFTGLDATQKKLAAIGRIAAELQLTNVSLACGRAEELGHDPQLREQFDIVTGRAVAELNVLLEYASPFVRPGGFVILWKSLTMEQEMKDSLLARAEFSCHLVKQHRYELSNGFGERQLLVFEKSSALSAKYPRKVGEAKKHPLK